MQAKDSPSLKGEASVPGTPNRIKGKTPEVHTYKAKELSAPTFEIELCRYHLPLSKQLRHGAESVASCFAASI